METWDVFTVAKTLAPLRQPNPDWLAIQWVSQALPKRDSRKVLHSVYAGSLLNMRMVWATDGKIGLAAKISEAIPDGLWRQFQFREPTARFNSICFRRMPGNYPDLSYVFRKCADDAFGVECGTNCGMGIAEIAGALWTHDGRVSVDLLRPLFVAGITWSISITNPAAPIRFDSDDGRIAMVMPYKRPNEAEESK